MRDTSGNKCMKILSQKTLESGELGEGRFIGKRGLGIREFFACCCCCCFNNWRNTCGTHTNAMRLCFHIHIEYQKFSD